MVSRRTSWRKQETQEGFPRLCKQYKQRYQEGAGVWGDGERWGTLRKGLVHRRHSVEFLKRKVRTGREKGGGKEWAGSSPQRQVTHPR